MSVIIATPCGVAAVKNRNAAGSTAKNANAQPR